MNLLANISSKFGISSEVSLILKFCTIFKILHGTHWRPRASTPPHPTRLSKVNKRSGIPQPPDFRFRSVTWRVPHLRDRAAGVMTLFHFGNCFALAYFPYFITYKCSGLSEYNAFWKCVQAGVTYLFVQLCKMLFLATFFPTWEGGIYDFIGEFMKASVDVADLIGLNLVMSRNAGKGEYKIMVAALGWATAELIMSRCIPLWVGARGIEFDWKYIQMSIDSNISLVHYIVASAQVWMITRYDLYHTFRPAVLLLMFLSVYKAFVMETFVHLFSLGSWTALLARAVVTGLLALSTLALYVAVVNVHS